MRKINIFVSLILIIVFSIFSYYLFGIGIISSKLTIGIYGAIAFIVLLLALLLCILKKKIPSVILWILSILLVGVFVVGSKYLNTTLKFINNMGKEKDEYDYYYVIALKNSGYKTIKDLSNKTIGLYEDFNDKIFDKINIEYEKQKYEDKDELLKELEDKNLDALLISDIALYFYEDNDELFQEKINIIYTFKIKKEKNKEHVEDAKDVTKEPFIVFLSGIDTSGKISRVSRSDVNILATVNPVTHEVLLTTIPRDYYVQLHGTTGVKDKLTHAGIYGIDKSVETIEDFLNIDISYYVKVNFDTVINLVNQLDGIDVYSDQYLKLYSGFSKKDCVIRKGTNHLDGECALRYSRERHSYSTGDRHRGENQEEVIKGIINKATSDTSILLNYSNIMNNLQDNFETNITDDITKAFIKMQVSEMPKWQVNTYNLNGFDSHNYTYSIGNTKLFVMEPDMETVEKAKELINGILDKKTFSELGI